MFIIKQSVIFICLIIIRNGFHVLSLILNVLMDHDEEWLSCMTLLWNAYMVYVKISMKVR